MDTTEKRKTVLTVYCLASSVKDAIESITRDMMQDGIDEKEVEERAELARKMLDSFAQIAKMRRAPEPKEVAHA